MRTTRSPKPGCCRRFQAMLDEREAQLNTRLYAAIVIEGLIGLIVAYLLAAMSLSVLQAVRALQQGSSRLAKWRSDRPDPADHPR